MARDRDKEERNERAKKAIGAMKAMGIPVHKAKPVLKGLLKESENSWDFIEADNYSVLVDALISLPESPDASVKKRDAGLAEQAGPIRKKLKLNEEDEDEASPSGTRVDELRAPSPVQQAPEDDASPQLQLRRRRVEPAGDSVSPQPSIRQHGGGTAVSPQGNGQEMSGPSVGLQIGHKKEQAPTPSSLVAYGRDKGVMKENVDNLAYHCNRKGEQANQNPVSPIIPKDEPMDDYEPGFEVPIAVMPPDEPTPFRNKDLQHQNVQNDIPAGNSSTSQINASEILVSQHSERRKENGVPCNNSSCKDDSAQELAGLQDASVKKVEIASSKSGEVKISLTCSSDNQNFVMPDLESLFKMVEDRCLKSYRILQPDFSLMNVMTELCQCVVELSSKPTGEKEESTINVIPLVDSLTKSGVSSTLGGISSVTSNSPPLAVPHCIRPLASEDPTMNGSGKKKNGSGNPGTSNVNASELMVFERQHPQCVNVRPLHDANDITKGEERVRISVVNEVSSERLPSSFHYIPQNLVYQNGYINFSLARIGDEDCCADCFGDCLAAAIPCACARETGGEFAYTSEGVIKKEFLDECISMNSDPEKHHHVYCKDCPLERSKNKTRPGPCEGHLVRKFIKECWSKCGCNKQCGNRVVQRGITCNLQVFYTSEGKGWGLRTLDDLPRGAFVCEYVGEILTNMELYERTMQTTGNARHTYPVLLDADWGSEGVLKDEEALCLDATFYGNVGRFVNHRCFDANLIEIPVEVETADHHYYHLAFFTTRKIEALEELTWDYGIDFGDLKHPVKAFQCRCLSRFCRDKKRPRTRRNSLVLK
ncbi:putative [histone H3]-lysine(4) N-trimethyltransferase chromatin remodeling SET family [Dioscorea sansibarensis]